jgi:hypothetical protein
VAINNRILKLEDSQVTFRYKESATEQTRSATVPAEEVIRWFLQHVLPDRCIKDDEVEVDSDLSRYTKQAPVKHGTNDLPRKI